MLKSVTFDNLTSVPSGKWEFVDGLNVIIGENGLGKSHVLKAIYSLLSAQFPAGTLAQKTQPPASSKSYLERAIAETLVQNMRPEALGRLVKRRRGRTRCEIDLKFRDPAMNLKVGFATNAKSQVELINHPTRRPKKPPVYIPTRELITLCPWFVSLYDNYHLEFEKSWRDTVSLLGAPSVRGPKESKVRELLEPIELAMGGRVEVDNTTGRFYVRTRGGRMEAPLVAEGLRKFAMLSRLISTGTLLEQGYLFWDEPETNLNPKLIKVVAKAIVSLARQGIQVFIATHSIFLLREIEMLTDLAEQTSMSKYFGIAAVEGEEVSCLETGETIDGLETIVMLDEDLSQSDRYVELHTSRTHD
jgi:predicted ATPase